MAQDYHSKLKLALQNKHSVYDIIDMDVLRSFTNFSKQRKEALKRILKTTAYILQDGASYCQGMNYIAGYFLIKYRSQETLAYYHFLPFIEKYMSELYADSFSKLQGHFYVMDSLIKNYIPNLHLSFKVRLQIKHIISK